MKIAFIAAGLVMLASCVSEQPEDTEKLMDLIESRIELPEGAMPLKDYSRYYFPHGDKIWGHLVSERKPIRKWIRSSNDAPKPIVDPGCTRIFVQFDPKTGKVEQASCGGVA